MDDDASFSATVEQVQFPRLAALAVVVSENRVLLVKRRNEPEAGRWGFPGGHVELGETALDAAARELSEETGIVSRPLRYLTNVDLIQWDVSGKIDYHFLLTAVQCEFVEGEPTARDDVSLAAWFDATEVLSGRLELSDRVTDVLKLALRDGMSS